MEKQRAIRKVITGSALAGALAIMIVFIGLPAYQEEAPLPTPVSQPIADSHTKTAQPFPGTVIAHDDTASSTPWQIQKSSSNLVPQLPSKTKPTRHGLNQPHFVTVGNETFPLRAYYPLATPNDPIASQWWVNSVRLNQAWDIAPGAQQTTLAVIDTGFALDHEDFSGRWHQNIGEKGIATSEAPSRLNCSDRGLALDYNCNLVDDDIDGIVDNESGTAPYENLSQLNCTDRGMPIAKECNRLDDDSNGYPDDVRGWDVVNQDSSVQAGELSPASSYVSHGTMVAGVAAATGNNGKGIAGVNWQATILPIQALDDDGYGNTRSVGEAIYYAIDQGADVINVSLGSEYPDDYVRGAIEAANAAGITVVAAAGNDGCDCVSYPAKYPEVIAVGAYDETGSLANFSSWGTAIDIAAPGVNYTLPAWSSANATNRYVSRLAGTSFSSPLVAGMAALLHSHQSAARPLHIIAALHETSNRSGLTVPDVRFGFGRFDASAARTRMVTARHTPQTYVLSPVTAGNFFSGKSYEAVGNYMIEDCYASASNLPIYELKNGSSSFYSISETEVRKANNRGYSPTKFALGCLSQPHDTTDVVRTINIFREFKNISLKP